MIEPHLLKGFGIDHGRFLQLSFVNDNNSEDWNVPKREIYFSGV
jgi:hypothetical protein